MSTATGHWLLVRLLRLMPHAPFAAKARELARPEPDAHRYLR